MAYLLHQNSHLIQFTPDGRLRTQFSSVTSDVLMLVPARSRSGMILLLAQNLEGKEAQACDLKKDENPSINFDGLQPKVRFVP